MLKKCYCHTQLSLPRQISASAYIHFLLNFSQLLDLLVDLPHPLDQGQPVLHEVLRGDVLNFSHCNIDYEEDDADEGQAQHQPHLQHQVLHADCISIALRWLI
eukprot:TRINITY_DN13446_c0_g1_i1.p1 TRINITY_DN13446_c0_g1~~TRINITY_DN13446_c0_g1_i1.p1  ORF type:complete len:103 (+),score=19.78 TRINITY_DN13446_c0_g1_i1:67-375(+)